MLSEYVQQWSAIQTVRAADLGDIDIFLSYFALDGNADEIEIEGYLAGVTMLPVQDRDLLAHAINELLDSTGSMVDGAHYSNHDATTSSGYSDYLRTLVISPEEFDFTAPPAGDLTASAMTDTSKNVPASLEAAAAAEDPDLDETEFRRLQALHESGLLETGAEERFDRLTRQARDHFGISSASIALITEDAQIIKSVTGPLGEDMPRDLSLCGTTIKYDRTLVINDASVHPDWRDHPLVTGGPQVRFYAGHPVCTSGGWRIGTLCLMDDQPRAFSDDDMQVLRRLAAQVQMEIWV
ncbi:GAF domain-containing protein [Arthrobacter cheniae]|uniref:GAF domain-containing protein n=1 Tax=Arthrobacter cheniae TaxID=1258888 RepID=UPI001602CBD1|nr:GAF domain-containing protein [Arthrobacter cheniae]